jgi:hypothetical protein
MMLTDDTVFLQRPDMQSACATLADHPKALVFSLRLGENTTWCYMLGTAQVAVRRCWSGALDCRRVILRTRLTCRRVSTEHRILFVGQTRWADSGTRTSSRRHCQRHRSAPTRQWCRLRVRWPCRCQ